MAKVKATWEGLTAGSSGIYIRPLLRGYEFGRWSRCKVTGGYRFTRLGERGSVEACREGLEAVDKASDARVKQLNKRTKR